MCKYCRATGTSDLNVLSQAFFSLRFYWRLPAPPCSCRQISRSGGTIVKVSHIEAAACCPCHQHQANITNTLPFLAVPYSVHVQTATARLHARSVHPPRPCVSRLYGGSNAYLPGRFVTTTTTADGRFTRAAASPGQCLCHRTCSLQICPTSGPTSADTSGASRVLQKLFQVLRFEYHPHHKRARRAHRHIFAVT